MRGLMLFAVGMLALAGCGSDDSADPDTGTVPAASVASTIAPTTSTTVPAEAEIPTDPCVFLKSTDELQKVFGVAFARAGEPTSSRYGLVGCGVEGPNGEYLFVDVDQDRRTEANLFQSCEPSTPDEAQFYEPVADLGEKAGAKNGLPQLCVLERGVQFGFTYTPGGTQTTQHLDQAKAFARSIIAQL